MIIIVSHKWRTEREDSIPEFTCPSCHAVGPGHGVSKHYTAKLFWLIPVWMSKSVEIHCLSCGAVHEPKVPYEQALRLSADELKAATAPPLVGGGIIAIIIFGWVMLFAPSMAIVCFIIGAATTWSKRTVWKWVSVAGIVASILNMIFDFF